MILDFKRETNCEDWKLHTWGFVPDMGSVAKVIREWLEIEKVRGYKQTNNSLTPGG